MPGNCYRCGSDMRIEDGAAVSMTSMHSGGIGEVDAFLCDECAELVRDVLEGEDA